MGQATFIDLSQTSRSGVPNINFQDAIESAAYNFPKAIAVGAGDWARGYGTSQSKGKLSSFLIYMPLLKPGLNGSIPINTSAKVKFGKEKIPIKLVFGGPSEASGTLFGLGVEMGSYRQLIRMDYHKFNPEHGGASGLKNDEISVWQDRDFHYHVRKWHQ